MRERLSVQITRLVVSVVSAARMKDVSVLKIRNKLLCSPDVFTITSPGYTAHNIVTIRRGKTVDYRSRLSCGGGGQLGISERNFCRLFRLNGSYTHSVMKKKNTIGKRRYAHAFGYDVDKICIREVGVIMKFTLVRHGISYMSVCVCVCEYVFVGPSYNTIRSRTILQLRSNYVTLCPVHSNSFGRHVAAAVHTLYIHFIYRYRLACVCTTIHHVRHDFYMYMKVVCVCVKTRHTLFGCQKLPVISNTSCRPRAGSNLDAGSSKTKQHNSITIRFRLSI